MTALTPLQRWLGFAAVVIPGGCAVLAVYLLLRKLEPPEWRRLRRDRRRNDELCRCVRPGAA